MFVDVDGTWKLPQKQRVVVDVSGIYFQLIAAAIDLLHNLSIKFRITNTCNLELNRSPKGLLLLLIYSLRLF
ncbi:hypothetical protein AGMMS49936_07270 [Endomicrobiia bacterium]|nr:hypothetical protein AGMMS49936_07270 [Endomicrobiia bacterium]